MSALMHISRSLRDGVERPPASNVLLTTPPSPEMSGPRVPDLAAAGLAPLRHLFEQPAAEVSLYLLPQHAVCDPVLLWQRIPLIVPSV